MSDQTPPPITADDLDNKPGPITRHLIAWGDYIERHLIAWGDYIERSLVDGHPGFLRLYASTMLTIAIIAATIALVVSESWGLWPYLIATPVLVLFMTQGALSSWQRARAYQVGWVTGRAEITESLREAMHRGMTPEDWVIIEQSRTLNVALNKGRPLDPSALEECTEDCDLYLCPTSGDLECPTHNGWTRCCNHPQCPGNHLD